MEVINELTWRRAVGPMEVEFAVRGVVDGAHGDGQIETLSAKVDKLTEIVAQLVAQSNDPVAILNAVDVGWREVK